MFGISITPPPKGEWASSQNTPILITLSEDQTCLHGPSSWSWPDRATLARINPGEGGVGWCACVSIRMRMRFGLRRDQLGGWSNVTPPFGHPHPLLFDGYRVDPLLDRGSFKIFPSLHFVSNLACTDYIQFHILTSLGKALPGFKTRGFPQLREMG